MKLTLEQLNWYHVGYNFQYLIHPADKQGNIHEFALAVEQFDKKPTLETAVFAYPTFAVTEEGMEVRFRHLPNNTYQVIMMYDWEMEECQGKGLAEAILIWWHEFKNCTIVSSSNNPNYHTSDEDQRSPAATKVWQRIKTAKYDAIRDQYVLNQLGIKTDFIVEEHRT